MMKRSTLSVCVGIVIGGVLAAGGQTAYTDPVGVFKLAVPEGNGADDPAIETFSIPLHRIPADRGRCTGIGTGFLADAGKTWTADEFARLPEGTPVYYIELVDGAAEGKKYEIISNTSDTLTLDTAGIEDPIAAGALAGDAYIVVPFYRIRDVFGEPGNPKLIGADSPANADNVLLWNGSGYETVYYSTFFGENQWRYAAGPLANDAVIWPGEGFFVKRIGPAITISLGGAVPVSQRVTQIQGSGLTLVGIEFPAQVDLDNSGLLAADGGPLTGGDSPAAADVVIAWTGTQYQQYYYSTFFGENIWRVAAGGPAGTELLEPGRAYFIREQEETGVLDWPRTLPYTLP